MPNRFSKNTSWQKVAPWYNKITEGGGHYYHQHVVIPGVLQLFDLKPVIPNSRFKILDLACGNGVLGKAIPKNVEYTGVDIAPSLISEARRTDHNSLHKYIVGDITKPIDQLTGQQFNCASIILALQNIANPETVLNNISRFLIPDSRFVIVLNHPAFRIPRQSSWEIDEGKKMQYRRIDRYMTPMEIPIRMNPSDPQSQQTMSYHYPISDYSKMLKAAGFVIDLIEEWTSDKESVGRAGRMENRARSEFPLFLAIKCLKKS